MGRPGRIRAGQVKQPQPEVPLAGGMSGWIKLEKDLREDPRFLRMLALLRNQELSGVTDVTQVRITERRCVTLLLGSLAQLWMYADSYLREDDTLDLGAHEVDQLVGIHGFCDMMP